MNRYPLWKYVTIALALVMSLFFTLPNFFGEAPAVQVSSGKATVKMDPGMVGRLETALKAEGIAWTGMFADQNSVKARFADRAPDRPSELQDDGLAPFFQHIKGATRRQQNRQQQNNDYSR